MTSLRQHLGQAIGAAGAGLFSFVLWTVWLGLSVLLVFQLYVATANELAIPDFVLRRIESRFADSGIRATFSRTSFDPGGRVLIENVRLSLPAFAEPVVTARSIYLRLNPWYLAVGRIEPLEIRLTGVTGAVPAMLSPSGRPEEIVQNLDATIEPSGRTMVLREFSARVAGAPVAAYGTLRLPPRRGEKPILDRLGEFVSTRFPDVCRQALALSTQLQRFENPSLRLQLAPSESGAPTIQVVALARVARLDQPMKVEATDVRAATKLLLFGDAPPSDIELSASELRLPDRATIRGVLARVIGRIRLDATQFDWRELAVTANSITAEGVDARAISALLYPRALPRFATEAVANVLDSPLHIHAETDLTTRQGIVRFDGTVSSRVLDVVSERVRRNVRRYYDFETLAADQGEVRFGPGWKFEQLRAHVRIPRMNSYGIIMEDGRATLELEPKRFYAPEAYARVGENFARGSYEHDLTNHRYRFLLEGQLRPLDISRWFREWWRNFFHQLEFPVAPPHAAVDVQGVWRNGRESSVFVFAEAPRSIIRGVEFDAVRTRLFTRPAFVDGLEVLARRNPGDVHGRFTYTAHSETRAWQTLDLGLDSTLDLATASQLLGPNLAKTLAAFRLAAAPNLKLRGQFAGPGAPREASTKLRIQAKTQGDFRFHEFPLRDVSFVATFDRDEIILDDVAAHFAGGAAAGRARVWGANNDRRLGFDISLNDASLGQVAAGLEEFFAAQKKRAPAPPGKFVQEKANVRINFGASAEGRYNDPFSYRGDGNAVLHGAEIGEVPLLGLLSDLLRFTSLRFTEARANFKIEGARVVFPTVTIRGANSAIDAHGAYALDRGELDFNAKIFPFQESGNLIKSVVGAVLTPLSNAFEVKLTGTLAKPEWAFVIGPTNFLRSLSPSAETKAPPPTPEANASNAPPE